MVSKGKVRDSKKGKRSKAEKNIQRLRKQVEARKKAQAQAKKLGGRVKVVRSSSGKTVGFKAEKTIKLGKEGKRVAKISVDKAREVKEQQAQSEQLPSQRESNQTSTVRNQALFRNPFADIQQGRTPLQQTQSQPQGFRERFRQTRESLRENPLSGRQQQEVTEFAGDKLGSAAGDVVRIIPEPKTKLNILGTQTSFNREKVAGQVEGAVSGAIQYPYKNPIQTAGFFVLGPTVRTVEGLATLGTGKVVLQGVKRKLISPSTGTFITTKIVPAVGTTAKAAVGADFAISTGQDYLNATTDIEKGAVLGSAAFEIGVVGVGDLKARRPGRIQERIESKVDNPLTVARQGGTNKDIEFAELVGNVGLELSKPKIKIQTKREVPFEKVSGVKKSEVKALQQFFKQPDRFVKGSTAQSTFLDKPLETEFIASRGGKFPDIDAAVGNKVKLPTKRGKTDLKEFADAQKIVGSRDFQRTPSGVGVQAFQEQSIRKAIGAFQLRKQRSTGKLEFGRLEKDVKGLEFNLRQAIREGKAKPSLLEDLNKVTGNKGSSSLKISNGKGSGRSSSSFNQRQSSVLRGRSGSGFTLFEPSSFTPSRTGRKSTPSSFEPSNINSAIGIEPSKTPTSNPPPTPGLFNPPSRPPKRGTPSNPPILPPSFPPIIMIPPSRPPKRPPSLPPLFPPTRRPPLIPKERKKKKKELQGYNVHLKAGGRWLKANKNPLTRGSALSLGSQGADNSASRSFRITKTKGKPQPKNEFYWEANSRKFREYKIRKGTKLPTKERFIEKTPNLIDTEGEIRGISAKGWIANRNKKSKRNFIL